MKNEINVNTGKEKIGIKEYLEDNLGISSRQVKKLLKEKKVTINGKAAYRDNTVKTGDKLEVDRSEKATDETAPQNIPLEVLYEDEYILAVNKPPFMLMHPTPNHNENTLANALRYYFDDRGITAPVRFLGRLDMNTSGVVVVPKQGAVHSALMKQMEQDRIEKKYIAVVEGVIVPGEGEIIEPIGVDPSNPIKRTVSAAGQQAVTRYKTHRTLKEAAVLEVSIITGRTHQIRVHMSHRGHPLVGDELYGSRSGLIDRQALHAYSICFVHPVTGVEMKIEAPIPDDIEQLIKKLANNLQSTAQGK